MNLINNAEWSMGELGGVLTIETTARADQKSIYVRVSDTGRGVAADVASKIFTPFFSTRDGGEALGLGLAACRGIVVAHQGTIRLVPKSERGATFEITLPVSAEATVFPALRTPAPESASPETAASARQRTILIANDDDDLREILTETLKKRGYLVHAVSNGVQALETVRTRPVDLVLMDTRMPERDGLSVLTELSSHYASLPVILITNRASQEETAEAIRLGARSCLSKPFEIKRLLSEVERFVVNS
jgi:CheY-like chemotaxis protein